YLASKFTGEDDGLHPQWVVMDLGALEKISVIRIDWADPYARSYEVQYWTGEHAMDQPAEGFWTTFPQGAVRDRRGGTATLQLATPPILARFLRIRMTESSNTCDSHGAGDPRNCVGYAITELCAGNFNDDGEL